MSAPAYCPACGAALSDASSAVPVEDPAPGDGGYDCYCDECGWSGDVYPDDEQRDPRVAPLDKTPP